MIDTVIQEELPLLIGEDEMILEEAIEKLVIDEVVIERKENLTPKMIPLQNVSVFSECLSIRANEKLSKNLKNLAKSKSVT